MLFGCKNLISTKGLWVNVVILFVQHLILLDLASFSLGHWDLTLPSLSLSHSAQSFPLSPGMAEPGETAGMGRG